jgi:hypothetical protein
MPEVRIHRNQSCHRSHYFEKGIRLDHRARTGTKRAASALTIRAELKKLIAEGYLRKDGDSYELALALRQ